MINPVESIENTFGPKRVSLGENSWCEASRGSLIQRGLWLNINYTMKERKVKLITPESPTGNEATRCVRIFSSTIVHEGDGDVYSTVEEFRKEVFPEITNTDMRTEKVRKKSLLSQIINLHNADEIRERSTSVSEMREKIESGKHVLMPDGLPNVKIVKTSNGELVCFDGHHSLLAYMMAGKKYLQEVPHLMVTRSSGKGLGDEEIHVFFGEHAKKLCGTDWRNYTISWTNPAERQLEKRKQEDMGELFSALGKE